MPYSNINGVQLYHESRGGGPALVTLHGGLGFDHVCMRTLAPLEDYLRVTYFDQRGNGRSAPECAGTLTMEELADDTAALIREVAAPSAIVLGHSYGGFVAQELAIRHPEVVRALILVDTTPGQLGATEDPADEKGPPLPEAAVAVISTPPQSDEALAEAAAALLPFYLHHRPAADVLPLLEGTIFSARAMARGFEVLDGWSSVDRLHQVTAPTLLIWGREDLFTSLPQAYRIARRIPNATVKVFDQCGHFPWLEAPAEFFAAAKSWLERRGMI